MEPFEEVPIEKWPVLLSKLKESWPLNVAGFYALQLNIQYPKVREAFQFRVYSPVGRFEDGFIATTFKDSVEVIIFCLSDDTNTFEEVLVKTTLIDWTQTVCLDLVNSKTLQIMNKVRPILELKKYEVGYLDTYFLDRESKPYENTIRPGNTYLNSVKDEHIQHVNEKWPYKHPASEFYFYNLSSNGLSYGLYSNDNKLIAWLFINEYNFVCHLYCEEEHRRKGFGSFLMKHVINEQLKRGNDVYGYVVKGNTQSAGLFVKLGFTNIDNGAYLYVQK